MHIKIPRKHIIIWIKVLAAAAFGGLVMSAGMELRDTYFPNAPTYTVWIEPVFISLTILLVIRKRT